MGVRDGGGDGGHLCETGELGLQVGLMEFAPVWEVGGGVGGVVVDNDDGDIALEEGKERVVLGGFAAVDEGECCLAGDEGGVGVVEEGVGIDGVFIAGGQGVRLVDDGGYVCEERAWGGGGDAGKRGAEFIEDVGGSPEDVAEVIVISFADAWLGGGTVGEGGPKVLRLGEGVDAGVETTEFVRGEFVDYGAVGRCAYSCGGFDVEGGDDGVRDGVRGEIGETCDGGKLDGNTTIGSVEELVGEQPAIHIYNSWGKAGRVLGFNICSDLSVCSSNG